MNYIYDTLKEQALESMLEISENYELWFEKVIVSVPGIYVFLIYS